MKATVTAKSSSSSRTMLVVGAWVLVFCISSISAFSVIAGAAVDPAVGPADAAGQPLWTAAGFALIYTYYHLAQAVSGVIAGILVDRVGPRKVVGTGLLLFCVGWFLSSFMTNLNLLYLTLGVMAGAGSGMVYNPTVTSTLRWFPDRRGKMSGLLLAAAALGPFVISPVTNALVVRFQNIHSVFRVFGVAFFLLMGGFVWFLKKADDDYLPPGYTPPPQTAQARAGARDWSWRKMISSPLYYMLLLVFICATTAGNMLMGANFGIAQAQIGVTAATAALAVSICSLADLLGRLSFGWLCDRLGEIKTLFLAMIATVVALALLIPARSWGLYCLCIALIGMAFGGVKVTFPPLTGRAFGAKNLSANYSFIFIGYAGSSFLGPRLAAVYLDGGQAFTGAYLMTIALLGLGIATTFLFVRKSRV